MIRRKPVGAAPASAPEVDPIYLTRMSFEMRRLRWVAAGLNQATARGDAAAASRWLAWVDRALADLDRAQDHLRTRRRPR